MGRPKGKKHKDQGHTLKNLITLRHLFQKDCAEFAAFVGITDTKRWSEVERGRIYPNDSEIAMVCTKFNLTPKILMDCELKIVSFWNHPY